MHYATRAGERFVDANRMTSRIGAIDLARGIALVAMAGFHLLWDLSFYGLIDIGVGFSPFWIGVQRSILTAFLLLVGTGLVLAHGNGIRWRSFWRRWLMIVASAAAVTAGTWYLLPDYVAYFGVLHAIALFSLLALPLIRAPLWVVTAIAAIVMGAAFYSNPLFNTRALSWIGFFTEVPPTTDLVPVFPWFGVMLLGIVLARLAPLRAALTPLAGWKLTSPPARLLRLLGRWSLLFYLLHQPLLLGIVIPLSQMQAHNAAARTAEFTQSCTASCGAAGAEAPYCTTYCQCALDISSRDDLWAAIAASPRSDEQQRSVDQMSKLCTAMAEARLP